MMLINERRTREVGERGGSTNLRGTKTSSPAGRTSSRSAPKASAKGSCEPRRKEIDRSSGCSSRGNRDLETHEKRKQRRRPPSAKKAPHGRCERKEKRIGQGTKIRAAPTRSGIAAGDGTASLSKLERKWGAARSLTHHREETGRSRREGEERRRVHRQKRAYGGPRGAKP